jgi:hypothetical protein
MISLETFHTKDEFRDQAMKQRILISNDEVAWQAKKAEAERCS